MWPKIIENAEDVLRKAQGTEDKKLLYVSGDSEIARAFVEAPYGASLSDIIAMAGGVKEGSTVKAVLVGGELGRFYRSGRSGHHNYGKRKRYFHRRRGSP